MKKTGKSDGKTLKKLIRLLGGDVWKLILALVFAFVSILLSLYINVVIGKAVDCMIGEGNVAFHRVRQYALLIGACILCSVIFSYFMRIILDRIAFRTVRTLRNRLFRKIQNVSISYLDRHTPGDMISRLINDIEQISDGLILSFGQLFSGVVTVLGTLFFMFSLDVKITLIVLFVTPVTLLVARFIANNTYKFFQKQTALSGELSAICEESVTGLAEITAFSKEEDHKAKLADVGDQFRKAATNAVFFSSTVNPTTRIINGIIYASVGVVGAITVIKNGDLPGGLTVGLLSSFLAYANQFSKPFNEISEVLAEFQGALAGCGRVFEVLEEPDESELPGARDDLTAEGSVEIDKVDFSYTPEVPLIRDFSLSVKPGMRVAIVGPTGCGKTTFINLLMRFYDTDDGSISVDNVPVREITRDCLHANYGMVLQETWLRSGTVRDNIRMGKPDATEEEIETAAKLAHAHHFITLLENGYDTVISNEGACLSYGQKQLLCIARLMLTSPPMLILDEATSSIDTRTEIRVQQGFRKLMQGRTSFIVAHRLSTIRNCDIIVVMKDGKILEQGSHGELIAGNGFYKELYDSQCN